MNTPDSTVRRRPPEASDAVVAAVGKASEALEYVERARGHLYSFHQLMGHADFVVEEAADQLREAGLTDEADRLCEEIVGRNALDGRWTFQIVEEYDDLYWEPVRTAVRGLEARHTGGRRHVFESELKDARRTPGRPDHAARPAAGWTTAVETGDAGD